MKFQSLEIGAGNGQFARTFLRGPCASDTKSHPDLDVVCDAQALSFGVRSFAMVVSCNPWGYGFHAEVEAQRLLEEVRSVLSSGGVFIVIGHRMNRFCGNEKKVRLWAVQMGFQVEVESVSPEREYPGYTFRRTDGGPTSPNMRITFRLP